MEESTEKEVEMFVVGLVLDPATNAPIVILKDSTGAISLPIWIGLAEATAIASSLKKIEVPRPMTHDLLKNLIDELGARVLKIQITDLQENTFFAAIEIAFGDRFKVIDARPSDAIALAVRVAAPILVARHVLAQAQVTLVAVPGGATNEMAAESVEGEEELGHPTSEGAEAEITSHEFTSDFAGVERGRWAELLADMDPDDFKYKM